MALRLVNTVPGTLPDSFRLGQPVQLGLKDTTGSVRIGSLRVSSGSSGIGYDRHLPQSSPILKKLEAEVSYVTNEHRQPYGDLVPTSVVGGNIVFTKTTNDDYEKSVYEIKVPINTAASILGYVKFKTDSAWTRFSPDWVNKTDVVGPYFSLEHGTFNTAVAGFLRDDGASGSLVLGGPLSAFSSTRPGQTETASLGWASLPDGSSFEMWFFFNTNGYPAPYSPANVPLVEVWVRRGVDTVPVLFKTVPLSSLGSFPSNGFVNFRTRQGDTDYAIFSFGLCGRSGDVLEIEDWRLFPDYRLAVNEGMGLPSIDYKVLPDSLVTYRASSGLLPTELDPGPWFPATDGSFIRPSASLYFPPGQHTSPYALSFDKRNTYAGAFYKLEPRLESGVDGAFVEAFMYGTQTNRVGDTFGSGLSIDDGTNLYRVVTLETATFRTLGISKNNFDFTETGYYKPATPVDWASPHLVRLCVDKVRDTVSLIVDEETVLELSTSDTFPATEGQGARVMFGDLVAVNSRGFTRFTEVSYSPRYEAWEIADQKYPDDAPYAWTLTGPAAPTAASTVWLEGTVPNATSLVIDKEDPSKVGSAIRYVKTDDFAEFKGFFVDFETAFNYYADSTGHGFGSEAMIDTGIDVFLGTKVLKFRFFECGIRGKYIGIVPGSGDEFDIINQTALGRQFSAPLDWTGRIRFRIVFRAYDSIQVWTGTTLQPPAITIPWRNVQDRFDLPLDATPPSINFGHLGDHTVSEIRWYHLRYGISNGYEVSVRHQYEGHPPDYLFGGPVLVRSEFDE